MSLRVGLRDDDHEAVLLAESHRVLFGGGQEIQAKALDGGAAVLGLVPAETLDPDPRAIGNQLWIDRDDAQLRSGLPERRGEAVIVLPVGFAAGEVLRHREASAPRLAADRR